MKKLVRTAKFNQKHWQIELCTFLHGYRNAPHVITQISSVMLFFNKPLKTYLPSQKEYWSPLDHIIRKNQNEKYERIKEYLNKNHNVKQSTLNIGDNVIMTWGGSFKKEDSQLYPTVFKVIETKLTIIMVPTNNGKIYTCHISFFKKVNCKASQITSTLSELHYQNNTLSVIKNTLDIDTPTWELRDRIWSSFYE